MQNPETEEGSRRKLKAVENRRGLPETGSRRKKENPDTVPGPKRYRAQSTSFREGALGQMRAESGKILIFGGTTEGRTAAERLLALGVPCTVCVATQYGEEVLQPHPLMTVHTGRLDRTGMAQMMREDHFSFVIDATHPHAQLVSLEIRAACARTGIPCLRLQREDADLQIENAAPQREDADLQIENAAPKRENADLQNREAEQQSADAKRLDRGDSEESADEMSGDETCIYVRDVEEAGAFLSTVPGRILVTTGSKELARLAKVLGDSSRITARVLPAPESLRACAEAGLSGKQIFAMQGPFGTDMNCALIRHAGAAWLLTKETGAAGGFPEKIEAVRKCGIRAVVIRKPVAENESPGTVLPDSSALPDQTPGTASPVTGQNPLQETCGKAFYQAAGLEQTIAKALQYAGCGATVPGNAAENAPLCSSPRAVFPADYLPEKRILSLVGIGVGAQEAGTRQAQEVIASAQVLFGAKSVLENLKKSWQAAKNKKLVAQYDSSAILEYLKEHPEVRNAAVAYSGDSGFYSGASSMLAKLKEEETFEEKAEGNSAFKGTFKENLEVRVICGISSVSWFAAQAGIPWQDWKILSSHGRFCNVIGQVRRNRECFLLLAGAEDLRRTGALLAGAQEQGILGDLQLIYGYELSRPEEKISSCTAQDLMEVTQEGLYVLYIRHDAAETVPVLPGLPDTAFIRGKAPMTSSEIRALSLCRLGLTAKAVVWDVGAGTGSVSVEAALACPEGRVWSVEYKKDALALLAENRAKYCLQNMSIIEGRAPEALADLPAPTHVFIGGSGGEIGSILDLVFDRNPEAKVVINCITSETLAALHTALDRLPVRDLQCTQVMVNREETLGSYHYLRAGNPVFIISFRSEK